jgi:purine-binding chemotaxis protein CheW
VPSEQQLSKSDRILSEIKLFRERREIADVDEPVLKVVLFSLAGDFYAFPGSMVLEILPGEEVSPIPGTPACITGLIIVRGDIESVVDLRSILCLPAGESSEGFILLASSGTVRSGILVDEVEDVVDVPRSSILAAPAVLDTAAREFVAGQFEHHGKSVTLLELGKIFAKIEEA